MSPKNQEQSLLHDICAAALIAAGLIGGFAYAATQGSAGSTSTATTVITLTIPTTYRVTSLADINFGTYSGTGALSGNQDICVFTNDATRNYRIMLTDNTTMSPSAFSVQNSGATTSIPFSVRWNGTTGTTGNTLVTYNTPLAVGGANVQSTDCSIGGKSANIAIDFLAADLQMVPSGLYSSTITVIIEP